MRYSAHFKIPENVEWTNTRTTTSYAFMARHTSYYFLMDRPLYSWLRGIWCAKLFMSAIWLRSRNFFGASFNVGSTTRHGVPPIFRSLSRWAIEHFFDAYELTFNRCNFFSTSAFIWINLYLGMCAGCVWCLMTFNVGAQPSEGEKIAGWYSERMHV